MPCLAALRGKIEHVLPRQEMHRTACIIDKVLFRRYPLHCQRQSSARSPRPLPKYFPELVAKLSGPPLKPLSPWLPISGKLRTHNFPLSHWHRSRCQVPCTNRISLNALHLPFQRFEYMLTFRVSNSPVYAVSPLSNRSVPKRLRLVSVIESINQSVLATKRNQLLTTLTAFFRCNGLYISNCLHLLRCRLWDCEGRRRHFRDGCSQTRSDR